MMVRHAIFIALAVACAVDAEAAFTPDKAYRLGELEVSFALRLVSEDGTRTKWVSSSSMAEIAESRDGTRTTVVWRGHPLCGAAFAVTAEFAETEGGASYAFRYDGNGLGGFHVEEIVFPDVVAPRTDKAAVLCPRSFGKLFRPRWRELKPDESVSSVRPQSFHFVAALEEDAPGVYLDQRDGARMLATRFRAANGPRPGTLRMRASYLPAVTSEADCAAALPFGGIVRTFRGGWYEAAQIYREWALRQPWAKAAFSRDFGKLRTVALWMWNRGGSEHVIAPAERFRRETGLSVALDWYWWHETPYDKGYPYFWPPREGEEPFRAAMRRLRKGGILSQVYTNGMSCDCDDPRWADGMSEGARRDRDGTVPAVMYNVFDRCRLAVMCGEAPRYHRHMRGLMSRLFGCGLDSAYLDQIGQDGCGECWNRDHRHAPGGGDAVIRGFREMLAGIKADNPGKSLSTEDVNEAYLDLVESVICLWHGSERYNVKPLPDEEMVPVFSAIYHGAVACFGSYAVIGGRPPWDPRWPSDGRWKDEEAWKRIYPADQFALEFVRGPVIGFQPCVHNFTLEQMDDPSLKADVDFVKATARFWSDNLDFLFDGRMLAPGRLACRTVAMGLAIRGIYTKDGEARIVRQSALPTVLHSVWQTRDGRRAAVLVNWTREPQSWRLDHSEVRGNGVIPPRSWLLVPACVSSARVMLRSREERRLHRAAGQEAGGRDSGDRDLAEMKDCRRE